MKFIFVIAILVGGFTFSYSQENSIITDRPDMTKSVATVPKKALQWETCFIFEQIDIPD